MLLVDISLSIIEDIYTALVVSLLTKLDIILDNMKDNDGNLRMNCSVTFYNQLTDEYNEIMKIKNIISLLVSFISILFFNSFTTLYLLTRLNNSEN